MLGDGGTGGLRAPGYPILLRLVYLLLKANVQIHQLH